jgi:ankyrin repeat protein
VDGGTPLLWAVKCDNAIGVELILKAGANPNYLNRGRVPAILSAAASGKPGVLKVLLDHGANPNVADGEWTPFRYALAWGVQTGDWTNYYLLLNSGADIKYATISGSTIAIDAAVMLQFDKVYELLERGYDINLNALGAAVQITNGDYKNSQSEWKMKVIKELQMRGVHFPVPPLHPLQRIHE